MLFNFFGLPKLNELFRLGVMDTKTKQVIDDLGGAAEVARLLGYDTKKGGVQRVNNWKRRGIPLSVLLDRPDLFPKSLKKAA